MPFTTGFSAQGSDLGFNLVEKSYLLDRYPELGETFRFAGLWSWGVYFNGRVGDNTSVPKSSPVQTVSGGADWKYISSHAHSLAIKTDGTLWTWGDNNNFQCTTLTATNQFPNKVGSDTTWKQTSAGDSHSAAIKTDGTLWLWGSGGSGGLGDNTTTTKGSPIQTISGGNNWKLVAAGGYFTAAIKTDGRLWVWGRNSQGSLGDNTTTNVSSPIQTVSGGTNWRAISCSRFYMAALKNDGTLWLWGQNTSGALGNGTFNSTSSPVQTVSGGTNWKMISCGGYHMAAIKTDGSLWVWGQGGQGQLGNLATGNITSPIQTVSGGTNWKQVDAGDYNTAAIKTDGRLWIWGFNDWGQLGDGTTVAKSSPIQTLSSGTNWISVNSGQSYTNAIRDNSDDLL